MKKLFLLVMLFCLCATPVMASVYTEDFEGEIQKGEAGKTAGLTTDIDGTNFIIQEADDNKYLEIYNKATSYALPGMEGITMIEMDVMLPPSGDIYIHLLDPSSRQAISVRFLTNKIDLYYGGTTVVPVADGLTTGGFYRISMILNPVASPKTVDVLLDGVQKVSGAAFRSTAVTKFNSIYFDVGANERFYVDNISRQTLEASGLTLGELAIKKSDEGILVLQDYSNFLPSVSKLGVITSISKDGLPVKVYYNMCSLPMFASGKSEIEVKTQGLDLSGCDVRVLVIDSIVNMKLLNSGAIKY